MRKKAPPDREISFIHIPKTAGTVLAGIIRRAYRPADSIPAHNLDELMKLDPASLNGYRCYTGHFGTALQDLLTKQVPTVTMLRDPFELYVSSVNHGLRNQIRCGLNARDIAAASEQRWRELGPYQTVDEVAGLLVAGDGLPLLNHPLAISQVSNGQVRCLGVHFEIDRLKQATERLGLAEELAARSGPVPDRDVYAEAVRNLESMVVVGLVEDMEASVRMVCRYLGVGPPAEVPVENVNPARKTAGSYRSSGTLTARQAAFVDQVTALDREFYEHAVNLHARQVRAASRRWWQVWRQA